MKLKLPQLPFLLQRKIYKTGQTRGADDDVIYQNRVSRTSTVLIPYKFWNKSFLYPQGENVFENGFIVLINPLVYFEDANILSTLKNLNLSLGENCLLFYETRRDWEKYNPEKLGWIPAQSRKSPLGGQYVARVPATTAVKGGEKIIRGFTTTKSKGAGIRLYEYASSTTINKCRLQLEGLYWLCEDSIEGVCANGMTKIDAKTRKSIILDNCYAEGLLDFDELSKARTVNDRKQTICPLCLENLPSSGFFSRMSQADGRDVPDLTVTQINLFHIKELKYSAYNHIPYNVGWGHHHCNVVTKDSGIDETLKWMKRILIKNEEKPI